MPIPDIIKETARKLRKEMTAAEKELWEDIRRGKIGGKQFLRQKPICVSQEDNGFKRYVIVDFVCIEHKVIIELDGEIHNNPEVLHLDGEKEILLKNLGYTVLRFKNSSIFEDREQVLEKIKENLF